MAQTDPENSRWRPLRGWRALRRQVSGDETPDSGGAPAAGETSAQTREDNPWLLLHERERNPAMPPLETTLSQAQDVASPPVPERRPGVRWKGATGSPYGFSDEDGSLKQEDVDTWRRAFGAQKPVAEGAMAGPPRRRSRLSGPSLWLLQTVIAAIITALGVYSVHDHSQLATGLKSVYSDAFTQDDETVLWTGVQQFLEQHHLRVPVLSTAFGAIMLHVPLSGRIVQDYTSAHPQMLIQGTANERVLSAGSGTVSKVVSVDKTYLIEIDHGSIGTSWYTGLVKPTVRVNEYVGTGQVIGQLPAAPAHPRLEFALEKNNHFENPHDYIVFPKQASSG